MIVIECSLGTSNTLPRPFEQTEQNGPEEYRGGVSAVACDDHLSRRNRTAQKYIGEESALWSVMKSLTKSPSPATPASVLFARIEPAFYWLLVLV